MFGMIEFEKKDLVILNNLDSKILCSLNWNWGFESWIIRYWSDFFISILFCLQLGNSPLSCEGLWPQGAKNMVSEPGCIPASNVSVVAKPEVA